MIHNISEFTAIIKALGYQRFRHRITHQDLNFKARTNYIIWPSPDNKINSVTGYDF